MRYVAADRSPIVWFLVGLAGVALLLAALEVTVVHRVTAPPERTDGVLTPRGRGQLASDVLWGLVLGTAGAVAFGTAIRGLGAREPLVAVGDEGIELWPGSERTLVPWEEIVAVRSGLVSEGEHALPVLEITVRSRDPIPARPKGAWWRGDTLVVDAAAWRPPVEEIALHADRLLARHRRGRTDREEGS